jgi:CubicO group peptidase (beta-lactamase class C family)
MMLFFRKIYFYFFLFFILYSCGGGSSGQTQSVAQTQIFNWEVVSPESQGMSATKVQNALDFASLDGTYTQAVLIIKNGKIIGENYRGIGSQEKLNLINHSETSHTNDSLDSEYGSRNNLSKVTSWSIGKSITSIIFGIAQAQGYFTSGLDVSASIYISEWANDSRSSITIRNLLDMRSGLEPGCFNALTSQWEVCNGTSISSGGSISSAPNTITGCIDRNLAATGQTHAWYYGGVLNFDSGDFEYSNCDSQVLGEILFRATGKDIKTFGDTYLFSKLGIIADWWRDQASGGQANGNYLSYCCIDATPRDFAKIALLIINNGIWLGEQIIPSSYIQAIKNITTTSKVEELGSNFSYGLKFWTIVNRDNCGIDQNQKCLDNNSIHSAIGFDGQYMMMDFTQNLIAIRFSLARMSTAYSGQKKMFINYENLENSNFIYSVPALITYPNSLEQNFYGAGFWHALNN